MATSQIGIRQKIGQLFMTAIGENHVTPEMINLLNQYHPGGILLTPDTLDHPKQVHKLTSELQHHSGRSTPLFMAVQQTTAAKGMTAVPSQQLLGAFNNRLYTKQAASIIGKEWQAVGINMNLAPDLRLSNVSATSFSENIEHTAQHGRAMTEGFEKHHIIAAATHFLDGDGQILDDTPLYKTALYPYMYAMEHGLQAMVTNRLKEAVPFLRRTAGFDGLIIYDTTEIDTEKVIDAIRDGSNLILLKCDYQTQVDIMENVCQAVTSGELSKDLVHEAARKTALMKKQYHVDVPPTFNRDVFLQPYAVAFMNRLKKSQEIHS